jgi:hypothetical protein
MRDVWDVLRDKEVQLETVRREVDALRLVAPLLVEELDNSNHAAVSGQIPWKDASTGLPAKAWP